MTNIIFTEVIDGKTCYCATRRGVSYIASELGDQWFVSSNRLALGRFNAGGGKYYKSLAAVAEGCKAFCGLDQLVSA